MYGTKSAAGEHAQQLCVGGVRVFVWVRVECNQSYVYGGCVCRSVSPHVARLVFLP